MSSLGVLVIGLLTLFCLRMSEDKRQEEAGIKGKEHLIVLTFMDAFAEEYQMVGTFNVSGKMMEVKAYPLNEEAHILGPEKTYTYEFSLNGYYNFCLSHTDVETQGDEAQPVTVIFTDGGYIKDAEACWFSNINSISITWHEETRLYNERMETFEEYCYFNGDILPRGNYGFILVVEEQVYFYQNQIER